MLIRTMLVILTVLSLAGIAHAFSHALNESPIAARPFDPDAGLGDDDGGY